MVKERVSLTLDESVVSRLDLEVDGVFTRSRSHAVEEILKNYFSSNRMAVILAGGSPHAMTVAGAKTFRPLADIGGTTLIEDSVEKIVASGCENIILAGSRQVNSAIFNVIGDGARLNCRVKYLEDDAGRGNAFTLSLASRFMKDTFLILPCDHYFTFDLPRLRAAHKSKGGLATIAVYAGTIQSTIGSLVEIDCGQIVKYVPDPREQPTHLNPTCIAYLEPEIKRYFNNKNLSLEKDLWPRLSSEKHLFAEIVCGHFVNLHTKGDVETIRKLRKK